MKGIDWRGYVEEYCFKIVALPQCAWMLAVKAVKVPLINLQGVCHCI
jgi:hypothetical protein